ncbi:MAG TPA: hypothetical protein VFI11_12860 [Anaerolineales bacterium]|nr:hypothetical protein [Anaerolineales bacterium]
MKSPVARAGLVAVSVFAAWWLFRLTERGVGIGSDSVVYMAGARNLFGGEGFVWKGGDQLPRPINHYPPLYSVALVPGLVLDAPVEDAARWMNAIAMGGNTFLAGALTGLVSSSGAGAVVGALLFVASEETISLHSWAMSDALYLFFALACAVSATRYLQAKGRAHELTMWMAASLGFLTRYVGASLFAIPLAAMLLAEREGQPRARRAAIGFVFAVLPGALWLARNAALTGSATNRRLGAFVQDPSWWTSMGWVIESWFLPGRLQNALAASNVPGGTILVVGLVVGLLLVWWNARERDPWNLRSVAPLWIPTILLGVSHLCAIAASAWLTYPGPDLTARNLAPILVTLSVLFSAVLATAWSRGTGEAKAAAAIAAVAFLTFKGYASRETVARLLRDGQGYTSAAWERSQTVRLLQELNPDVLYANDVGAAYYFTGRFAYEIPHRFESLTLDERTDYHEELCRMWTRLRENGGLVVFFETASRVPELPTREDLQGLLPMVADHADGAIFKAGAPPLPECGLRAQESEVD